MVDSGAGCADADNSPSGLIGETFQHAIEPKGRSLCVLGHEENAPLVEACDAFRQQRFQVLPNGPEATTRGRRRWRIEHDTGEALLRIHLFDDAAAFRANRDMPGRIDAAITIRFEVGFESR